MLSRTSHYRTSICPGVTFLKKYWVHFELKKIINRCIRNIDVKVVQKLVGDTIKRIDRVRRFGVRYTFAITYSPLNIRYLKYNKDVSISIYFLHMHITWSDVHISDQTQIFKIATRREKVQTLDKKGWTQPGRE